MNSDSEYVLPTIESDTLLACAVLTTMIHFSGLRRWKNHDQGQ